MIKEVQEYFDGVLLPQLNKYGVSETFQADIVRVVSQQMYSVLVNWDDPDFLRTLFLTVSEESPFYHPDANSEVKAFVVLTIRNSPIETLQSDNYHKAGLSQKLKDDQLIEITSNAITYFSKHNFAEIEDDEEYNIDNDVYFLLSQKYRIAWNALSNTANGNTQCGNFQGLEYKEVPNYMIFDLYYAGQQAAKPSIMDGYEPTIDNNLRKQLSYVVESKSALSVDCFKMLSRNMGKLLFVIELLLQKQCGLVTSNYYIANGYYEKRVPVIKAASSANAMSDMKMNYSNFSGVGTIHKKYLMAAYDNRNT